jgi:hypothetical protein
MTPATLTAQGFAPLTEFLDMPYDEETLESILYQLRNGKHCIPHCIYRPDPGSAQVWAKPVTQAYEDKL